MLAEVRKCAILSRDEQRGWQVSESRSLDVLDDDDNNGGVGRFIADREFAVACRDTRRRAARHAKSRPQSGGRRRD